MTTSFESSWRERLTRATDVVMTFVALVAIVSLILEPGEYLSKKNVRILQMLDVGIVALFVLANFVVPRLLGMETLRRNRELPILVAVVLGIGSAVVAPRTSLRSSASAGSPDGSPATVSKA